MKLITLFVLGLCIQLALSLKELKGQDISKDYAIGKLVHADMKGSDQKILFRSIDNVLGFIDEKTGVLLSVYELQEDQTIIDYKGFQGVIISKQKDINMFFPKDSKYIKLQYSQFLEKQTFKRIIAFKRFYMHDYILTDEFLLKAENPYASSQPKKQTNTEKYQILAKNENKDQTFFNLILLFDKDPKKSALGLATIKKTQNKKQLCIKKLLTYDDNRKILCVELETKQQFKNVVEMGPNFIITYETYKVILDNKGKKIHQSKNNQRFSFHDELSINSDPSDSNNLNNNSPGKTLLFYNVGNPKGSNNLQYFLKYMLVRKEDKVIVSIEKESEDVPVSIWAFTLQQKSTDFTLIVEFQNGKIFCYRVNETKKSYQKLWSFTVKVTVKSDEGEQKEAVEVDLQQEQKRIQSEQKSKEDPKNSNQDIQNNQP